MKKREAERLHKKICLSEASTENPSKIKVFERSECLFNI